MGAVVPPSGDDERLARLFLRSLADGDGKLTRAELRRAPQALLRYDLDDDEYLSLAELLTAAPGPARPVLGRLKWGKGPRAAILRAELGTKARVALAGKSDAFRLVPAAPGSVVYRLRGPDSGWTTVRAALAEPDVRSVEEFLVAQLEGALGGGAALTKASLEDDLTLGGLRELWRYADRNGDGRLSVAELKAYLALVAAGLRAQVWVSAADRGHNPFPFLDADGDGRLSYREMLAAADLLGGRAEMTGLPAQAELTFGRAPVSAWGGVAVPKVSAPRRKPVDVSGAPRWFRAMDRNGDGVLSPREFLGPPEVFRELDADGDGVISPAEAARATPR
jgi:Ca2+-binding EF-hand superfamily protein